MKKINFKAATESLTRNEMKSIMGGSGSDGSVVCDLTVAACWHFNNKNRNNAYQNSRGGWTCCPK